MTRSSPPSRERRHLLLSGAGAVAAAVAAPAQSAPRQTPAVAQGARPAGPKPLPAYAAWKDPGAMIVHSGNTVETQRAAFGTSIITPAERLYIRNNLPPPDPSILADRDSWELAVEGVRQSRKVTLRELRQMGLTTVATVLQCSGNGRGFFPSKPSGTPWTVGAAGCVIWSGVPVLDLVQALGGTAGPVEYMTGTGGEKLPEGIDPRTVIIERSLPIRAMQHALLAWEMNGAPLPLAHGGPLRLVVPGYSGVNNIKYVKRLAFGNQESDAKIMTHGYRVSPPGSKADPSQPSVLEMSVKSWINSPLGAAPVSRGKVQIHGVAFGGVHPVRRVDVSVDGGSAWHPARFVGPDLGPFAWRQFVLEHELRPGRHTLASRAVDTAGNMQPAARHENLGGYNNSSWADHMIRIEVA